MLLMIDQLQVGLTASHGGPLRPGKKRVSMRVSGDGSFARALPAMNDVRDPSFCLRDGLHPG